jgi:hypothetical protein
MKKTAVLILAALLIIPALTFGADDTDAADNPVSVYWDGSMYEYKTSGVGNESNPYAATIVKLTKGGQDPLRIKSMLEGYPLTTIGSNAFSGSGAKSVIIPESVTSIGDGAFSGSSLKDVYFLGPKPVIGTGSFGSGVIFHYTETYADSWKDTKAELFPVYTHTNGSGQALFSYYVLNNEATIHKHLGGADIVIPDTVSADGATVPVTSIGPHAFRNDDSIVSVTLGANIREIGERAFYHSQKFTDVTFSSSLVAINDEAFREASVLNPGKTGTVIIPSTVKYLGFESFRMCHALTQMTIPSTVEYMGDGVLRASFNLKKVVYENKFTDTSSYFLDNCNALTDVTLPEGLITIGSSAFTGDKALVNINIPSTVETIGSSAFYVNTSLKTIHLTSVKKIGNNAFSGCTSLETIHFGDSIETIGSRAFFGDSSLSSVILPASIKMIDSLAFGNCFLFEYKIPGTPEIAHDAFQNAIPSEPVDPEDPDSGDSTLIIIAAVIIVIVILAVAAVLARRRSANP